MTTMERYEWLIQTLQKMLGWQIDIEKSAWDRRSYEVFLAVKLRFAGQVWPDILRSQEYRQTVFKLVEHKLERLWDEELAKETGEKGK